MEYIDMTDLHDAVLECIDDDIAMGNDTIAHLADKLGVTEISLPASYIVKRLGIVSAYYNCCLRRAGTDPTTVFNGAGGVENSDIFAQKLKLYKAEMDRLLVTITAADFGVTGGHGRATIPMYRG